MRKFNFGVIGAGTIGRMHIDNICGLIQRANVVAVSDIREEVLSSISEKYSIMNTFTDYHKMLDLDGLDGVIICTNSNTHPEIVEACAVKKIHVLCEKPLAVDLDTIDRLADVAASNKIKLHTGFNRRFDPNFSRVRKLIENGKIGTPHILKITSRDPEPPALEYQKTCGGIFLDMTIHDFDMARFISNSEVEEVYVTGAVLIVPEFKTINDIDTCIISLKFKNNMIGTIDNSMRAVFGYDQRIEVFGDKGMIEAANVKTNTLKISTGENIYEELPPFFFVERYVQSYVNEIYEFMDAVFEDREPAVSILDAKMPVAIAEACRISLHEGRPVRLSEII